MPAFKMSAARIFAGLAASAFFTPAFCATLVVNNETPLDITTPPGFTYTVGGGSGSLAVSTDGFLLCSNVFDADPPPPTAVTVMPQHGDWRMPVAQDVQSVSYNFGELVVNRALGTSLVCHAVGAEGEVASAFSDGVFRNSYETKAYEQLSNLVNWIPSVGFDWNNPDWSLVPTDICNPTVQQPAAIIEDVTCAGVTGFRPAAAGAATRSPTLWTGTDGVSFFYVARVDARFGAQAEADRGLTELPLGDNAAPEGATGAVLNIVDAYDRGVVGVGGGYLGDTGQWCVVSETPTALTGNMCVGAPFSGILNGPLTDFPSLHLSVPPLGIPNTTFYIVFIRPIVGAPPAITEPAVAVSILLEPSVAAESGDRFRGDDVAFGFLPASQGFPWMNGP
jgi:hypothetical protein